jgi:uncharacterized protein (DUF697 family)
MHNIDRTVGESNYEFNELNPETYEYLGELGNGQMESEDEFLNELQAVSGEYGQSTSNTGEFIGETSNEANQYSNETLEMELANQLLEVTNEEELEQFLGGLIKKAAGAVSSFARSSAGKALGGILKAAAKKALPIVGGAVGTMFGGPAGSMIGGKLGSLASNLFELELEGLSNEDKEYELSRAYVRFANSAVRQALRDRRIRTNPKQAVKAAVISSAKRYAPGLLRRWPAPGTSRRSSNLYANQFNAPSNYNNGNYNGGGQDSGTWYKQGNQLVINL